VPKISEESCKTQPGVDTFNSTEPCFHSHRGNRYREFGFVQFEMTRSLLTQMGRTPSNAKERKGSTTNALEAGDLSMAQRQAYANFKDRDDS
jgi:hypothetical protein